MTHYDDLQTPWREIHPKGYPLPAKPTRRVVAPLNAPRGRRIVRWVRCHAPRIGRAAT